MFCYLYNGMGGNPTGNAHHQAGKVKTCQLCIGGICRFVSRIVNHKAAVHDPLYLCLQCGQCEESCPQKLPIRELLEKL